MYETALDHYAIIKRVHVFCESNGYGVNWIERGEQPKASNRGIISIMKPLPSWSKEQLLEWEMTVYHEIGHLVPAMRDIFPLMEEKQINMGVEDPELLPALWNQIDDYRQEHYQVGRYKGRDSVLSKGRAQFEELHTIPLLNDCDMSKTSEKFRKIDAMEGALLRVRSEWQRDLIGVDTRYTDHFTEQQKEWYDKVLTYADEINAAVTAEQEYELAKKLIEEVFGDDPEEEERKAQQQTQEQGGTPQQQQGQGTQDGQGQQAQQGGSGDKDNKKAQKAKGKGEGEGDDKQKREEDAYVKYEDIALHHDNDEGPSYHSLTIDYSTYRDPELYKPSTDNKVYDFIDGSGTPAVAENYKREVNNLDISTGLANKLRKLLQVKSQSLQVYGQKSGKLAGKNVHRVTLSGTGEYQRKVFKKKIVNNILDTAVTVLVDFSGSMGGEKMPHAIASALLLNDALAKIGVPVEVTGFSTSGYKSNLFVFKKHVKPISREVLLSNMCRATNYMNANADGEAILWAYDRLVRQKNKRKLLIVLSDGQPAGGNGGNIYEFTKKVVKKIEEKHNVEIYGIGIMSDSVENIYSHNRVIESIDQLESAVLTVIRDYILN